MTQRANPISTVLLLVTLIVVTSGCSVQNELIVDEQRAELDAAYAAAADLRAEVRALRDSLQFYDDIESGQYHRDRSQLTQQIERLRYDVGLCLDGGRTVETLLVDDLFEPGSTELTDAGRDALEVLTELLRTEYTDRNVRIEGHADSTPIGPSLADRYPSNWELSAHRAAAIVRFLVDVEGFPAGQFELAALGAARPVANDDTAAGRSRNRRIRVAVMPQ